MSNLTSKQQQFIKHYVACLNATEAARLSEYKGNDVTLASVGAENLRKPHISAEISRLLAEKTIQADEVLARLSEQATLDLSDFFDFDAKAIMTQANLQKAMERGKTHLIKSIKFDGKTGYPTHIEFHSAQNALIHLGKAYGLFTDRIQIDDWRSQAITDIRDGKLTYEAVAEAFDDSDLATELFALAGVPLDTSITA